MKKALITGGAGFIGYHLASNLLNHGYEVDLIDNFARGVKDNFLLELSSKKGVKIFDLDLLNKKELDRFERDYNIIFHLAAIIGVQYVLKMPYDVLSKNVELLQNIILFGKEQKNLSRLVFVSTSEIYAGTLKYFSMKIPTPESTPLTITDLSENRTSYMLSKIYGEALSLHSGLPVTIVRPHNFYGPRMGLSHVVPELFKKAFYSNNNTLEVFSANHKRTFCYIEDAVEMIRILSELNTSISQAYNIGNDSPEISIEELAQKIIKIVGKDLRIVPQNETAGSPSRRCPEMTKTFETTGYKPKFDIITGLQNTFDWYKMNVFLGEGVSAI
jgi:nucleoside-diphosphate-sugar epimerase